jgi:hypothetical protein
MSLFVRPRRPVGDTHSDSLEESADTAFDVATLEVETGQGTTVLDTFSNVDAGGGYVRHDYDLSGFAGQTVTLRVGASEDESLATSFVVDDVSLVATG